MRGATRVLRAAAAVSLLASAASAQTWERLPFVPPETDAQNAFSIGFLRGEGPAASDPAADSLLMGHGGELYLFNPSGAGGAAGSNGPYGAWHVLCANARCAPHDLVVTASNTILFGSRDRTLSRSTTRGRTWNYYVDSLYAIPLHESALPALAGTGGRGLAAVVSDDGRVYVSRDDGLPGTWIRSGLGGGLAEALGEVPPSASLPSGRLLMGVWDGVTGSTDGGASFQPTSLYRQGGFIAFSFAFLPQAGHPYGGAAFVIVDNTARYPWERAELHRSDDGGQTWTFVHRFTGAETGLPLIQGEPTSGYPIGRGVLTVTPDGALWAGVHYTQGPLAPGVIMRSGDAGVTWSRADDGFTGFSGPNYPSSTPEQPYGWRVRRLVLSRAGVLYAATDRGVWRTTQPVVAAEAWPTPASSGLALSVSPNPSRGAATVTLTAAEPVRARVVVTDAVGREVEAAEVWATPTGSAVSLDVSGWAAGVYVARASVGQHTQSVTARFTVVR